jgi:hypothetical protein
MEQYSSFEAVFVKSDFDPLFPLLPSVQNFLGLSFQVGALD